MDRVRINLGSGHWKLEGWVNVDLDLASRPEVCADLSAGLPFRDSSADLMHSEDFLDQLELAPARAFLAECHRILRPGGVLRILTPDLRKMAHMYLQEPDRLLELWKTHVGVPLEAGTAAEVFNLGMRFAGHTFIYDEETLACLLDASGFEARRVTFGQSDIPDLRGLDLRSPENAISMYFDCYRKD